RYPLLPPPGEAAPEVLPRGRRAEVEAQQLVRQHDAERLRIVSLAGIGAQGLRLELVGRFPQVLVEEEHPRPERALGKAQLGIDQRSARIDVEISHPRED